MDSKNTKTSSPVRRLAGQMAGQLLVNQQDKSFRSKSKDKLINGKVGCAVFKNKNCSKVSRIARVPSKSNLNNCTLRMGGMLDVSGDTKAGTSKLPNTPSKKNITLGKLKPSHIPRRKATFKQNSTKEPLTKKDYQFHGDSRNSRNVQRIQLLINQDFRPEEHALGPGITSTRPIPTLGNIYTWNNVMDTDRLDDWFVELDTPANSIASNFHNMSSRVVSSRVDAENANEIPATNKYNATAAVTNLEFDCTNYPQNGYKTTEVNSDWMSSDIEYPTRDNESGYRSLSPPAHTPMDIKSKHSKCSFEFSQVENSSENNCQKLSESSSKKSTQGSLTNESTTTTLKEQPTVVLAQITSARLNESLNSPPGEQKGISKPDHSKNYQYPSRTGYAPAAPVVASQPQVTAPSYVECPSEILQKTTNFEDMTPVACDSPNTLSSINGTDLEFHDDLSSQCMMEREDCCIDHGAMEWCHQCRSYKRDEKSNDSEDTSVVDSLMCQYNDDIMPPSVIIPSDDHHWRIHYDAIKHCKKCQRYRRFPSTRYKLPKTLSSLRRHMSLRLCRRRLSRVWKKTAERWAMWAGKSPHKYKKIRMMHYLHSSLWEDADVQTNVFVYRETGTEPTLQEQKSAAVSAVLKFEPSFTSNKNGSGTWASSSRKNSTKFRRLNFGPSMYPLFYNSKKKSLIQQKFQEKQSSIVKENNVDNKKPDAINHKKIENHVVTQTLSCFQSKNKYEVKQKGLPEIQMIESDNYVEICEVNMDNKQTSMEDMAFPMKDNVTSTVLDLDGLRLLKGWESQNAHTQMCIVCNNAETDVKFPSTRDSHSASVLTSMSENTEFHRPCGTNTDMKNLRSINIMTSTKILDESPTFSHIDTQVTPVQSLQKISTGILTSMSLLVNKSTKRDMSTVMDNDLKNRSKDFNNQVIPQRPSFMCAATKSTSTTKVAVQAAFAVTSRKEFECAEVLTSRTQIRSGVCLTSPSLQQCQCPKADILSRGTATTRSKYLASSNKLNTYLNTGMLINTLVEGAMQSDVKPSRNLDMKSIGNKYTSEIATCTNSELKGSVIEKKKDKHPKLLSVETNTLSLRNESKSTDQRGDDVISQKNTNNCTQHSHIVQKVSDMVSDRSERIRRSRLMAVRTLSQSTDEAGAQTEPVRIDDGVLYTPKQYKCTSVFTSRCALDEPMKPALSKNVGHNNDHFSSSVTTSRRKSSSHKNSSFRLNASVVLSSDLDADKWIKSCIEKGYQSQLDVDSSLNENKNTSEYDSCGSKFPGDKKSDSKSVGSETQSECQHTTNNVTTAVSAISDTALEECDEDSLKDAREKQIVATINDGVTSDQAVKKGVKEITLRANRNENSEAETKCMQAVEHKSACVFTSKCILPSPSPCSHTQHRGFSGDCLFVYGKPRCVMHSFNDSNDASIQMSCSRNGRECCSLSTHMPSDTMRQQHCLRSVGMLTTNYGINSPCRKETSNPEILSPREYEALYETSKRLSQEEVAKPGPQNVKNFCSSCGVDAEVEANFRGGSEMHSTSMLALPDVRSAGMITSQYGHSSSVLQCNQFTQQDPICYRNNRREGLMPTNSYENQYVRLLEIPTHDDDCQSGCRSDCCGKTPLMASCRYYSELLTKQLDRVRENLTQHITPLIDTNYTCQIPNVYTEACTMKPSACEEFGCQTLKNQPLYKGSKYTTILSPAVSLTDICRHDKEHLKSVYYTLTAIEGRLRRLKANM